MTVEAEQVIEFLERLFRQQEESLNPLQKQVLQLSWEGKKYDDMEIIGFSTQYLKTNIGPELWDKLTEILRQSDLIEQTEEVKKKNLPLVMEQIMKRSIPIDLVGQTIASRFKIVSLKSKGEFGNTYIGEDLHLKNIPCFIKQLKARSNLKIRRKFEREVNALYQLSCHRQIPNLLAGFEDETGYFLVHEFIKGTPLSNIFSENEPSKCWSEDKVVKLVEDILNILEFVHKNNIIHRDIKPSNLIKKDNGEIVLINFASIKEIDNDKIRSFLGGHLGYTAPEQNHGTPLPCSDIYGVAMVGIQALTGLPPTQIPANRDAGQLIWHEQGSISSELANILDKMSTFDYKNRYQSVQNVLEDLNSLNRR